MRPLFSLIVPTRRRPDQLRRMLDSVARTAHHPEHLEIVLVIDSDDLKSRVTHPRLSVKCVIGPHGRTMGELNNAGFEASTGAFVMLLNDDVIVRTRGWDAVARRCFAKFPDPFVLLHVNDVLMRDNLCVFPLTSRAFYELAGGVCPPQYQRYRIDDHIEDVFNLLGLLGERRVVYLPGVVFEHDNATPHPEAGAVYLSDPAVLALDAPTFDALLPARKELALKVFAAIDGRADPDAERARRATLAAVRSAFDIRLPGRQRVMRSNAAVAWDAARRVRERIRRARAKSLGELARIALRRMSGPSRLNPA
ncbi:MAG: glycosyltransferase [Gemmataceae bacterium]|nr:glycosyltransferase [Gemmataceae bacterium]